MKYHNYHSVILWLISIIQITVIEPTITLGGLGRWLHGSPGLETGPHYAWKQLKPMQILLFFYAPYIYDSYDFLHSVPVQFQNWPSKYHLNHLTLLLILHENIEEHSSSLYQYSIYDILIPTLKCPPHPCVQVIAFHVYQWSLMTMDRSDRCVQVIAFYVCKWCWCLKKKNL